MSHIPVLLNETLQYLDPKPNDNFIDCTVGEGGHALAILKMTAPDGVLLGIDRDADMIGQLRERAERLGVSERLILRHGNFADISELAKGCDVFPLKGVLFDLGMSSWQLERSGMGFSFKNIEPLDMRFDRTGNALTAAEILNSWPKEAIRRVISEFGEEKYADRIAKEITASRKQERIETTDQLVGVISRAVLRKYSKGRGKIHFATRTFQALRIAVNGELDVVRKGVSDAIGLLSPDGRIAVISFHSLEDRIIKNVFSVHSKARVKKNKYSRAEGPARNVSKLGLRGGRGGLLRVLTKKPVTPGFEETAKNPRSRSAKLRVAEKLRQ